MPDLVERYLHEVGRSLPARDRADIATELRSMIYDSLEDRYGGAETAADIAALLKELGDPRKLASSYLPVRYLIGPEAFPYLMTALRYTWVTIPTIFIFLQIFGALTSVQPPPLSSLILEMLVSAIGGMFVFTALVIMIFAVIERIVAAIAPQDSAFDPLVLPPVNDPHTVARSEVIFGIVFSIVIGLILIYFLYVGGLTLRFDINNPADLIPVPRGWLVAFIVVLSAMVGVHVQALRTNRWTATLWLIETIFELLGMICLYFVLYEPVAQRLVGSVPSLASGGTLENIPELMVILNAILTVIGRGSRQLRLWNYRDPPSAPVTGA